jgi:hypothetical protein
VSSVAGWYPDPSGSSDLRYWDGLTWSEQTTSHVVNREPAWTVPAETPTRTRADPNDFFGGAAATAQPPVQAPPMIHAQPGAQGSTPYALGWHQAPQSRGHGLLMWIVGAIATFIVICILAAIAIPVFLSKKSDAVYNRTSIAMPQVIAGFTKSAGKSASATKAVQDYIPTNAPTLAGVYEDTAGVPAIYSVVLRYRTNSKDFSSTMRGLERGFGESGVSVGVFTDADTGPLGGKMQCAPMTVRTGTGTACWFVDGASIGLVEIVGSRAADHDLTLQVRSAVERRR